MQTRARAQTARRLAMAALSSALATAPAALARRSPGIVLVAHLVVGLVMHGLTTTFPVNWRSTHEHQVYRSTVLRQQSGFKRPSAWL